MPVVRVKGVANPMQFPDDMDIEDIKAFLQRKFASQAVAGNQPMDLAPLQGQARASEQSLAQKAGQGISNALVDSGIISDRFGAQQIGKNVTSIGEFLPGIGDATAGDEFGRALKQGDNFGMAMGALGAIPLVGDAAKKVFKGKVFHQTNSDFDEFDFDKTSDGTVWFTDNKANFSDPNSSAGAAAGKGRIIERDVELNNVAGYDELDKYSVDELVQQGYDGAFLDGDIQVFDPKAIKSPSTDKAMSVGGGIKAYHGTPNKFNEFDLNKVGSTSDTGMFGKGFYFTEDQALAKTYAKKEGRVIEAELNLKNDIPNIDVPRNTKEDFKNADKNYSRLFTEKLQSQGYDGVIDNMTSGGKQFVVFDPKAIKQKKPR
jgi:hypothetical protein